MLKLIHELQRNLTNKLNTYKSVHNAEYAIVKYVN